MRGWGWWLGGIAMLAPVVALGVLVLRFDPNVLKPFLAAAAEAKTGRALVLQGDIRIVPALWPTIEVSGATLANLPGGSRPHMVRAERVAVQLSLPALLQRRIEVERLTLTGPDILFEQVEGQPNWRFDLPGQGATADGRAFQLDIRNAAIRNGMVTWRMPARTKVLGIRAMEVEHHSAQGPISFAGTFVYSDNQPFRLTGSALPTAGLADPWTTRLDLAAFDTMASATGVVDTAGIYDLQLEATSGALERLNALLPEMRLPPMHQVALSARLGNGRQNGDLPVVGAARLRFADADLSSFVAGLRLGAFDVSLDRPGGTATLSGAGRYRNQGFAISGKAGVPRYPDERASLPVDLALRSDGAGGAAGSAAVKGKVGVRALAFDGLDAAVTLSAPALAALGPLIGAWLPALTRVQLAGHVVVPANRGSVAFSGARLASAQGDLAGDGSYGLGAGLVLSGRFRSGTLDLDGMLDAFGIDLSPDTQAAGPTVIPAVPLDWGLLRGPTLDVGVAAETVRFLDESWHGVDLGVQLRGGRLQRGTLSVVPDAAGGGAATLSVTADASRGDASRAVVPVALTVSAPALPLSLVARYAGLPGRVSGTARVEARVEASGASLHELASTLSGTASLASVGGQMSNAAFVRLTGASLQALGITVPAQGETAVRCLGVGAAFQGGVGTLRPIALETSHLSLDGEGQVDLRRETLSLQLKPLAAVSGASVSVPVVVEGPFRGLTGRLDANLFDKLGLLVDAWFGGDRSTACADAGLLRPGRQ